MYHDLRKENPTVTICDAKNVLFEIEDGQPTYPSPCKSLFIMIYDNQI